MHEVWITGLGVIGPHGLGLDVMLKAAARGVSAFSQWPENQAPPTPSALVGSVPAFPKERFFTERQLRQMDRVMALAACAVGLALEDAKLGDDMPTEDTATFFGTARAEHPSLLRFALPLMEGNPRKLNPANFPLIARNISCGQIAIRFGLRGPSTTLASGSLSSLEAICRAYDFVRLGRAPVAVVGGAEILSKFSLYIAKALYGEHLLPLKPSFLGEYPGQIVPSEGACMLILESAEHARARKAKPYARLDGWHSGRAGRMEWDACLLEAWLRLLAKVGNIYERLAMFSISSGGSNRRHEIAEARALARLYATNPASAFVCAPRSMAGEGEAWTSALQVAVAASALRDRHVSPTLNLADDASGTVRLKSEGGQINENSALVSGIDNTGVYNILHMSGCHE